MTTSFDVGARVGMEKVAISDELAQRVADERLWNRLTAGHGSADAPKTKAIQVREAAEKEKKNRALMAARGHRQDQGVKLKRPRFGGPMPSAAATPDAKSVTRAAKKVSESASSVPMGRKGKAALIGAGVALAALAAARVHRDMTPKKYAAAQTPAEADRDISAPTTAKTVDKPLDEEARSDATGRQKKGRGVPEWVASLTGKKS